MSYLVKSKSVSLFNEDILSERMKGTMEKREQNLELTIENVKKMLSTMNYGSITLVIQDNVVVQIERNEKIRLK